jgi:dTDP-4-dehydrorhamnose reductase
MNKTRSRPSPRIILFGATSIVGWNIFKAAQGMSVTPFCNRYTKYEVCHNWPRVNLEDHPTIQSWIKRIQPNILIHSGGICDVDRCEENPEWVWKLNVIALKSLLEYLPKKTRLVYCSSDHVFGGNSNEPYFENSKPNPITVYGRTRVAAEKLIQKMRPDALILRYGLGVGSSVSGKTGHLNWLQYRHKRNLPITIIKDEYRSAVWAAQLARRILEFATSNATGIRHIPATQAISRLQLAQYLNAQFKIGARLRVETRKDQPVPHLGRVELKTRFKDSLAKPLPSVVLK